MFTVHRANVGITVPKRTTNSTRKVSSGFLLMQFSCSNSQWKWAHFFLNFEGFLEWTSVRKIIYFRPRALLFWKFHFLNWCSGYSLSMMYFFYIFNWRLGTFLDAWKQSMILSIVRHYFVHFKNAHVDEKNTNSSIGKAQNKGIWSLSHFHPHAYLPRQKFQLMGQEQLP